MNDKSEVPAHPHDSILVAEADVLTRNAIAEYLRHCGYKVLEAASADEAITLLTKSEIVVDIVFSAVEIGGSLDGFGLAKWIRTNRQGLEIILTGNIVKAAHVAGDLCEDGPHLQKPYEPQQVVEWIKKLRNIKI